MGRISASSVIVAVVSVFAARGYAQTDAVDRGRGTTEGEWIPLFDGKTFEGWYPFLQKHKPKEDPAKIFQAHDGMIHVYRDQEETDAVAYGCLATDATYSNYHLRLEYKWGAKRFRPRAQQRRDAGLLYQVVGADVVWPRCLECQIQEGDTGDCFTVRGTQVTTTVEDALIETPTGRRKLPRYQPEDERGHPRTIGEGSIARIVKSSTHERDGWNTVEVIVRSDEEAVHIVNGRVVFRATKLRQLNESTSEKLWEPLANGRIALQAEFAEVFYRNIEIRPVEGRPLKPAAE